MNTITYTIDVDVSQESIRRINKKLNKSIVLDSNFLKINFDGDAKNLIKTVNELHKEIPSLGASFSKEIYKQAMGFLESNIKSKGGVLKKYLNFDYLNNELDLLTNKLNNFSNVNKSKVGEYSKLNSELQTAKELDKAFNIGKTPQNQTSKYVDDFLTKNGERLSQLKQELKLYDDEIESVEYLGKLLELLDKRGILNDNEYSSLATSLGNIINLFKSINPEYDKLLKSKLFDGNPLETAENSTIKLVNEFAESYNLLETVLANIKEETQSNPINFTGDLGELLKILDELPNKIAKAIEEPLKNALSDRQIIDWKNSFNSAINEIKNNLLGFDKFNYLAQKQDEANRIRRKENKSSVSESAFVINSKNGDIFGDLTVGQQGKINEELGDAIIDLYQKETEAIADTFLHTHRLEKIASFSTPYGKNKSSDLKAFFHDYEKGIQYELVRAGNEIGTFDIGKLISDFPELFKTDNKLDENKISDFLTKFAKFNDASRKQWVGIDNIITKYEAYNNEYDSKTSSFVENLLSLLNQSEILNGKDLDALEKEIITSLLQYEKSTPNNNEGISSEIYKSLSKLGLEQSYTPEDIEEILYSVLEMTYGANNSDIHQFGARKAQIEAFNKLMNGTGSINPFDVLGSVGLTTKDFDISKYLQYFKSINDFKNSNPFEWSQETMNALFGVETSLKSILDAFIQLSKVDFSNLNSLSSISESLQKISNFIDELGQTGSNTINESIKKLQQLDQTTNETLNTLFEESSGQYAFIQGVENIVKAEQQLEKEQQKISDQIEGQITLEELLNKTKIEGAQIGSLNDNYYSENNKKPGDLLKGLINLGRETKDLSKEDSGLLNNLINQEKERLEVKKEIVSIENKIQDSEKNTILSDDEYEKALSRMQERTKDIKNKSYHKFRPEDFIEPEVGYRIRTNTVTGDSWLNDEIYKTLEEAQKIAKELPVDMGEIYNVERIEEARIELSKYNEIQEKVRIANEKLAESKNEISSSQKSTNGIDVLPDSDEVKNQAKLDGQEIGKAEGEGIEEGVRDATQVHSPSPLFREIGKWIGISIDDGMEESLTKSLSSVEDWKNALLKLFKDNDVSEEAFNNFFNNVKLDGRLNSTKALKEIFNNKLLSSADDNADKVEKLSLSFKDLKNSLKGFNKLSKQFDEIKSLTLIDISGLNDGGGETFVSQFKKYINDYTSKIPAKLKNIDITQFKDEINVIEDALYDLNEAMRDDSLTFEQIYNISIQKLSAIEAKVNKVKNTANPISISKLLNKIDQNLNDNPGMSKDFEYRFKELRETIVSYGKDIDSVTFKHLASEFEALNEEFTKANQNSLTLTQRIAKRAVSESITTLSYAFNFQQVLTRFKEIYEYVVSINSAMIELKKVSDATDVELSKSLSQAKDTARELGASITEIISLQSDWARLGYSVADSSELARVTQLFTNIGDNMSTENASEYLISTLKGFNLAVDDAESIIDKYNEVANNFAIDTAGLGEALERSASSLYAANTDLSESLALIATANAIVQDPSSVGTTFKTLSARIRGAKTELEELGEEEDEYTKTTSKLRGEIKALTGFDIMRDENTYKSIYEILLGIGREWKNLTDIEQASLGEALAGKRNANTLYSVLNNIDELEDAYNKAQNSVGSAEKEQEAYSKSIEYSISQIKALFEELSTDILQSETVKSFADSLQRILKIIDDIIKQTGVLAPLITVIYSTLNKAGKTSILGIREKDSKAIGKANLELILFNKNISTIKENLKSSKLSNTTHDWFYSLFGGVNDVTQIDKNFLSSIITDNLKNISFAEIAKGFDLSDAFKTLPINDISVFENLIKSGKSGAEVLSELENGTLSLNKSTELLFRNMIEGKSSLYSFVDIYQSVINGNQDAFNGLSVVAKQQIENWVAEGKSVAEVTSEIKKMNVALTKGDVLTKVLKIGAELLAQVLVTVLLSAITKLIQAQEEYEQKTKQLGETLKDLSSTFDDYNDKIQKQYDILNDNTSSIDDQIAARKELLEIQQKLNKEYGSNIKLLEKESRANKNISYSDRNNSISKLESEINDNQTKIDSAKSDLEKHFEPLKNIASETGEVIKNVSEKSYSVLSEAAEFNTKLQEENNEAILAGQKYIKESYNNRGASYKHYEEPIEVPVDKIIESYNNRGSLHATFDEPVQLPSEETVQSIKDVVEKSSDSLKKGTEKQVLATEENTEANIQILKATKASYESRDRSAYKHYEEPIEIPIPTDDRNGSTEIFNVEEPIEIPVDKWIDSAEQLFTKAGKTYSDSVQLQVKANQLETEATQKLVSDIVEIGKDIDDISDAKDEISDAKQKIKELNIEEEKYNKTISSLKSIQEELYTKYGDSASNIDLLSSSATGAANALKEIYEQEYKDAVLDYNANTKWTEKVLQFFRGGKTNQEYAVSQIDSYRGITLGAPKEIIDYINKLNSSVISTGSSGISVGGDAKVVLEDLTKLYDYIQKINEDGHLDKFTQRITNEIAKVKDVISTYGEVYDQYVMNELIFPDDTYNVAFVEMNEALNEYQQAITDGNEEAAQEAADAYVSVFDRIINESDVPDSIKNFFKNMSGELSDEINNTLLDRLVNDDTISKINDNILNNNQAAKYVFDQIMNGEKYSYSDFSFFGDDLEKTFKQFDEDILQKYNIVKEQANTFVDDINDVLNNPDLEGISLDGIEGALDPNSDDYKTLETSARKAGFETITAFLLAMRERYPELIDVMTIAEEEITGRLKAILGESSSDVIASAYNHSDATTREIMSTSKYRVALREWLETAKNGVVPTEKELIELAKKISSANNEASDSFLGYSSLSNLNKSMKDLDTAYDEFMENGRVSVATLVGLDESWTGLTGFEAFEQIAANVNSTKEEIQNAFDEIVTEYIRTNKVLNDITEENKDTYIKELTDIGITNAEQLADEMLNFNSSVVGINTAIDSITNAMATGKTVTAQYLSSLEGVSNLSSSAEIATAALAAQEYYLKDGFDNARISSGELTQDIYDSIGAFESEGEASDLVRLALFRLIASIQIFNNNGLSVSDKISALEELAKGFGIVTAEAISANDAINNAGKIYDSKAAEQYLNSVLQNNMSAIENAFANISSASHSTFAGVKDDAKSSASDAEKEAENLLDAYLDYQEACLDNMSITVGDFLLNTQSKVQEFYDNGLIDAEKYWNSMARIAQKQQSVYDMVISAVTDEIDSQTKALEKQKKQIESYYDGLIKPLEDQIKALEDEKDALQKANEERKAAIDLQKAQYELERARSQRTKLVNVCEVA